MKDCYEDIETLTDDALRVAIDEEISMSYPDGLQRKDVNEFVSNLFDFAMQAGLTFSKKEAKKIILEEYLYTPDEKK